LSAACTQFEPLPDIDTSTGESGSGGGVSDDIVFDGDGIGEIIPVGGVWPILGVGVPGEDDDSGRLQLFRAHPSLEDSFAIPFADFATIDQSAILGDRVVGDRFGSVLMPTRVFATPTAAVG
jgi:hypothetical protein